MKYFIIMGLVLLGMNSQSIAQQMINGDFAINSGNCTTCERCTNVTLTTVDPKIREGVGFPNWYCTHGTPNFIGGPISPNAIFMASTKSSGGGSGEGIIGGYNFQAGKRYRINIGLKDYAENSILKIALVSGPRPETLECVETDCYDDFYNGKVPYVNPSNIVHIALTSGYASGDNYLYFTLPNSYDWVWVYAHNNSECYGSFELTHVLIDPVCDNGDLYLTSPTVAPNTYEHYRHIFVGSSYVGGTYTTSISGGTNMRARGRINFENKTIMTPSNGNPIVASISQNDCVIEGLPRPTIKEPNEQITPNLSSNHPIGLARAEKAKREISNSQIAIYPNPVEDQVTIANADYLNTTITILSVDGKIQKRWNASQPNETVSLSDLNSGVYFIKVNGPNTNFVEKVIIK